MRKFPLTSKNLFLFVILKIKYHVSHSGDWKGFKSEVKKKMLIFLTLLLLLMTTLLWTPNSLHSGIQSSSNCLSSRSVSFCLFLLLLWSWLGILCPLSWLWLFIYFWLVTWSLLGFSGPGIGGTIGSSHGIASGNMQCGIS